MEHKLFVTSPTGGFKILQNFKIKTVEQKFLFPIKQVARLRPFVLLIRVV